MIRTKRTALMSIAFLASCTLATMCIIRQRNTSLTQIQINNINALADSGADASLDTQYAREEGVCKVTLAPGVQIKVRGKEIISAGADGTATFDGKVICHKGGDATCTPVECKDIYEVIF